MAIHDHNRYKVVSEFQHLYEHQLTEFEYSNAAMPFVLGQNASDALDYIFSVLYPKTQPSVEDVTQLPTVGNTLGDQRIVQDGRFEILSAGVNSVLALGVLELSAVSNLLVGDSIRLGNISVNKTSVYPDGKLYVGAITNVPETVTLYEDIALLVPADLSGLALADGAIELPASDTISGDNAETWMWAKFDGQPLARWEKIGDLDWGMSEVIQALQNQTQYLYVKKYGTTDYDLVTKVPLVGNNAGQHIYGGELAGQNLILHANNGDDAGVYTGAVFLDDDLLPMRNNSEVVPADRINIGSPGNGFDNGFFRTLTIGVASLVITDDGVNSFIYTTNASNQLILGSDIAGTDVTDLLTAGNINAATVEATTSFLAGDGAVNETTIAAGSITTLDNSGINFGSDPLSTTGLINVGSLIITEGTETLTFDADNAAGAATILSTLPALNFGGANLVTSGNINGNIGTFGSLVVDFTTLDNNILGTSAGSLTIDPAADIIIGSNILLQTNDITGDLTAEITAGRYTTRADAAGNNQSLNIYENIITSTGDINFAGGNLLLDADRDIGSLNGGKVNNLYMPAGGSIRVDDTALPNGERMNISQLMDFKNANTYRQDGLVAVLPVLGGPDVNDILKWTTTHGWVSSNPDNEIDHTLLTNIVGAGANLASTYGGDSGHTQFLLNNGRVGGQRVYGGPAAQDEIKFRANLLSGLNKGLDITDPATGNSSIAPSTDGNIDLGSTAKQYDDLFMTGEGIGFRAENYDPTIPAPNEAPPAVAIGRLAYNQEDSYLMVSDGATWGKVGHNTHKLTLTDITILAAHTLPVGMDGLSTIWQLIEVTTGEIVYPTIAVTATTVTVSSDLALTSGSNYTLLGIQL